MVPSVSSYGEASVADFTDCGHCEVAHAQAKRRRRAAPGIEPVVRRSDIGLQRIPRRAAQAMLFGAPSG
jgi:hypothetical protein